MKCSAQISKDGKYRYDLWRTWDDKKPYCMFIGLNPSTADAVEDDPTIRRCIRFAKDWGYGGLVMANLFAFRATKPEDMKKAEDPIGEENDDHLELLAQHAGKVVASWGVNGTHHNRDKEVMTLLGSLSCLGVTKAGHPKHPLYLKADTTLVGFK